MPRTRSYLVLLPFIAACADEPADDRDPTTSDTSGSTSTGTPPATTDPSAETDSSGGDATTGGSGEDSTGGGTTGGSTGEPPPEEIDCDASEVSPASLIPCAARSTCDALFRCCADSLSLESYFFAYGQAPQLESMASMFPPNGEITPDNCEAVLTEAFSVKPFGPWVDAVEQGLVEYDGTATRQCLDTLDEATCAEGPEGFTSEVAAALYDAGCLAFTPPLGGLEQRSMFTRTASSGQCLPLTDGNGGAVYGTCDPQTSFCCVAGDTPGSCFFSSAAEEGQCVPASASGQACFLDVVEQDAQFCRTGLECSDYETGECFEPPQPMPMQIGDVCYDSQTFTVIGECVGGYCDLFDTEQCVALIDDGEACEGAEQCEGGACLDGMCGQSPFCTGVE